MKRPWLVRCSVSAMRSQPSFNVATRARAPSRPNRPAGSFPLTSETESNLEGEVLV